MGRGVRNPRGAGKKVTNQEEIRKIRELREKRYKIRMIAEERGCSVGRVHKLINEQSNKEVGEEINKDGMK